MIPKKIHYCWFGKGEKSKLTKKCIASWKKYCSDYEIIEWNEDNFDINMNGYTRMCYEQKKYAFLSDYVRLLVVAEYGGIYLDTDVEIVKSLDELLLNEAFFAFENTEYVASGLGFGSIAHGIVTGAMLDEYNHLLDGTKGTVGCPRLNTNALLKLGLIQNGKRQVVQNAVIYPVEYFNPMNSVTGEIHKTDNTYSIHRYSMSWLPRHKRIRSKITQQFHRFFGINCFAWLKRKR